MFTLRFTTVLLVLACLLLACGGVMAAQVDCDQVYCFTSEEFSQQEQVEGICITGLPDAATGTVMLGSRVLQPGDILTAQQLSQMTFHPLRTELDAYAVVSYLPIYADRVEKTAEMTISIRGKVDEKPVAQDSAVETYKNLPIEGKLKVTDPEQQELTYTVLRGPKRGEVELRSDGSFVYTPKKNKVGVDSFTYTATDTMGNVSREATVTVQIIKPTDAKQYTDTIGESCRFAAEWLKNTGLFVGEQVGGQKCFYPEKTMSRGEFLTMLVQVLELPVEQTATMELPEDTPQWLRPYLQAAHRAGVTDTIPVTESGSFGADQPITGAEAAVMIQNALELSVSAATVETDGKTNEPAWAEVSLAVMAENGIALNAEDALTRAQAAETLYAVSKLCIDAPGMTVIRMQK